jgi:hypothetical protein
MKRIAPIAWILSLILGGVSPASEMDAKELATRVRSIFLAKCSECHGRTLQRPKAGLYLHDLQQITANHDLVVPFKPENSYLWTLVQNDDMPAKGASAGPLNTQEKEIVHAWITAGAPSLPSPTSVLTAPSSASAQAEQTVAPLSLPRRLLGWVGKFHLLVIHFPIALLAVAALGELLAAVRNVQVPEPAVRFCVLLGTTAALWSVVLGWLHADLGGHGIASSLSLGLHRWLGTTAGLWAVAIALISERDNRRQQRSGLFCALLWSGTFLVAVTAHFGGLLVHGDSFFDL